MRRPKDRDFVETKEGFFFCLIGYLHPPNRYTAYLKYTQAGIGEWTRGDVFFRRELPSYHVRNVLKTVSWLAEHHPQYVWFDPARNFMFSFVPKEAVVTYYLPEECVAEIVVDPRDPLEEEVKALVELFTKEADVSQEAIGITGSVLLSLHNSTFSDIDLLVYGKENALKVKKAVLALEATIADPTESLFLPAIYRLTDVKVVEACPVSLSKGGLLSTSRSLTPLKGSTARSQILETGLWPREWSRRSMDPTGWSSGPLLRRRVVLSGSLKDREA